MIHTYLMRTNREDPSVGTYDRFQIFCKNNKISNSEKAFTFNVSSVGFFW